MSSTYNKGFPLCHESMRNRIMHKMNNVIKMTSFKFISVTVSLLIAAFSGNVNGQTPKAGKPVGKSFQIPEDYLREAKNIPSFWITTVYEVTKFLKAKCS